MKILFLWFVTIESIKKTQKWTLKNVNGILNAASNIYTFVPNKLIKKLGRSMQIS